MSSHAKLSPSGSPKWLNCPGSVWMEEGFEDKGSKFADEGAAAHFLGATCLVAGSNPSDHGGKVIVVGPKDEFFEGTEGRINFPELSSFIIDDEMVDNVATYVDAIRAAKGHGALLVEQKLDFSQWVPNGYGTGDAVIINTEDGIIEVHDLKYGKGVMVHAPDNTQLLLYALGAYCTYSLMGSFSKVKMVIHQPRLHHLSEAEISIEELLAFAAKAKAGAEAALKPDARCIAGEVQCRWCKAKAVCPAAGKFVADAVGMDFDNLVGDDVPLAPGPEFIPNEQLPNAYAKVAFIQGWCQDVAAYMMEEMQAGTAMPGYKLVKGKQGNRQWSDDIEAEKVLKSMRLKHHEMYDSKLISPTTAEKVLKGSVKRWNRAKGLIIRAEGKPTIALATDKRPAISSTADAFSDETLVDDLTG